MESWGQVTKGRLESQKAAFGYIEQKSNFIGGVLYTFVRLALIQNFYQKNEPLML